MIASDITRRLNSDTIDWSGLSQLTDDPSAFFKKFLPEVARACEVQTIALAALREPREGESLPSWRLVMDHPHGASAPRQMGGNLDALCRSAFTTQERGEFPGSLVVEPLPRDGGGGGDMVLIADFGTEPAPAQRQLLHYLAGMPESLLQQKRLRRAEADLSQFAAVLDLTVLLYSEDRFQAAVMLLCNETATRFKATRVSLGWLEGNQIRIRSISHTDKIEARMESVQLLASAMEEAVDQGIEIRFPDEIDRFTVTHDHRRYSETQKAGHLLTLPLIRPGQDRTGPAREDTALPMCGAIMLERDESPFTGQEARALRLLCDQVTPRLWHLKKLDGWFGARAAAASRRGLSRILGVDHTWMKLLGLGLAVALGVLIFGRKEFTVKAPFALETDSVVFLAAPFNGYLSEAGFDVGDEVAEREIVFALDTSGLLLEKQAALAEITRFDAEAVSAEAEGEVAGMRIARAQLEQAQARLEVVQHQLEQAEVRAAFDGVVVEGDLSEKIDAPVEQGDVLIKLGKLSGLYPEMKINEADIRYVETGATGRVAFAARPDLTFPLEVLKVEPSARPEEGGNLFTVRCEFTENSAPWWRPGMTGVARIDCGKRSLLWIYTHRTVDRIRLFLW